MTDRLAAGLRAASAGWISDSAADMTVPRRIDDQCRALQAWGRDLGVPVANNEFLTLACPALYRMHYYTVQQVLDSLPDQRAAHAKLLFGLGLYERVVDQYPEQDEYCAAALLTSGRYAEVLKRYPQSREQAAMALVALGRPQEVLRQYPGCAEACAQALWALGRPEESVRLYPLSNVLRSDDLGAAGDMLARLGTNPLEQASLLTWGMGRPDSALAVLDRTDPMGNTQYYVCYSQALGQLGRHEEILRRFSRVPYLEEACAEALIAMGRSAEVHTRYPRLAFARALAHAADGEFDSALQQCREERTLTTRVLWGAGRLDSVLSAFPHRPSLCATVLLARRRFGEVLARHPDQRPQCARALFCLGRYDEVLRAYPDQRDICALALYRQGKAPEAIARYPETRASYADALVRQGRFQAVADSFTDQPIPYAMALQTLGRTSEIPMDHGLLRLYPSAAWDLQAAAAIREFASGHAARADSLLPRKPAPNSLWCPHRFSYYMLAPVLKALAGDTAALREGCRAVMREHRYHSGQRLWYDAALLGGAVSDSEFLSQPYAWLVRQRFGFWSAVRSDIHGQRQAALDGYRQVADDEICRNEGLFVPEDHPTLRDIFETVAFREFLQWRMRALGDNPAVR